MKNIPKSLLKEMGEYVGDYLQTWGLTEWNVKLNPVLQTDDDCGKYAECTFGNYNNKEVKIDFWKRGIDCWKLTLHHELAHIKVRELHVVTQKIIDTQRDLIDELRMDAEERLVELEAKVMTGEKGGDV